ncbi:hypothetical protein JCM19233_6291 [Vibrio astriarenae]|nr:hypothetical protein JCM19233_6291 [Vibrio sp. C7]
MALDKAVPEWVGVLASEENLESEGHQGILMSRCGEKRIKYSDNIVDTQLLQREALWLTRVEQMGIDTHRCIEFCRDGLFAILATSYIRGASLTDVIKRSKDALLPERHLNDVISNILDRVDELHAVGIIHGDLKPNNVLMSASGIFI